MIKWTAKRKSQRAIKYNDGTVSYIDFDEVQEQGEITNCEIDSEYNSLTLKTANAIGKIFINYTDGEDLSDYEILEILSQHEYHSEDAYTIAKSVIKYGNEIYPFAEKEYYRIGKPIVDTMNNQYLSSYNFADDKREVGVSVVTLNWLHSFKSVFFGGHDDTKIAKKGVYKIKGFVIGFGGDDEPLIYPTEWAEKQE